MSTQLGKMGIVVGIGLAGLVLIASQSTVEASPPVPSPTPQPSVNVLVIGDAEYRRESSSAEREECLRNGLPVPATVHLDPALIAELDRLPVELPTISAVPQDFVDNWETLYSQDFEGAFPDAGGVCQLIDADALPEEHLWDDDNHRSHQGDWAAWPANGGNDGIDPASNPYPNAMKTQMVCGPFDLSQAYNAMTEFALWYDLPDTDDRVFFGVSGDGGRSAVLPGAVAEPIGPRSRPTIQDCWAMLRSGYCGSLKAMPARTPKGRGWTTLSSGATLNRPVVVTFPTLVERG